MQLMVEDEDVAELHRLLLRVLEAINAGELEASPAQTSALSGAAAAVWVLQQTSD